MMINVKLFSGSTLAFLNINAAVSIVVVFISVAVFDVITVAVVVVAAVVAAVVAVVVAAIGILDIRPLA